MSSKLPAKFRKLDDGAWLDMLIKSISVPRIDGVDFPGFPPEAVQITFNGNANESSLREAFKFFVLTKKYSREFSKRLTSRSRFLDFGCGWGRLLRFFWKEIDEGNLYGCDVNSWILDVCRSLSMPGQIDLITPLGTLPYPQGHFDNIIAHSVFTHLPERVHLHAMRELARVSRRGCVFCLTLEPRRFIDEVANLPAEANDERSRALKAHQPRVSQYLEAFDSGNLAFMPTNKGVEDTYGDAVVPLAYIEREWSPYFRVRAYIDDPAVHWQAVLVVQRL